MQIHRARGFKARALQGSRGINGPPALRVLIISVSTPPWLASESLLDMHARVWP